MKLPSRSVQHWADLGAVETGIADKGQLRATVSVIQARASRIPGIKNQALEVQEQVSNAVEALPSFGNAPLFGWLVVVCAGGSLAELAVAADLVSERTRTS